MKTTSSMDPTDMVKEIKKVIIKIYLFFIYFIYIFRYLKIIIAIMSNESSSCYFVFTVMAGKII